MKPHFRLAATLCASVLLAACGFHLRRSAQLPPGMQQVYIQSSGNSDFRRSLARALEASGSTVVKEPGPGVAELVMPVAGFSSRAVTVTGRGRISEFAVLFNVQFQVVDDHGTILVPQQKIGMSREFTYDASQAIGRQTQVEAIRSSMVQDMVRSVMFRLQSVAAAPAPAASTAVPAAAASTAH